MIRPFTPTRRARSLMIHVLATILVTLATNGLIFAFGWAGSSVEATRPNFLLPPGWVIGGVWVVLLALLTVAYWWLASDDAPDRRRISPWVLAQIAFCLAYPFYTFGLRDETIGFIGDLTTMAVSAFLAGHVLSRSRLAASLIFLPVVWVSYAAFAVVFGR